MIPEKKKRKSPRPISGYSVRWLKARGYRVTNAQRFVEPIKCFMDAWGFADLLAYRSTDTGILAVQVTDQSHVASRVNKLLGLDAVCDWVQDPRRRLEIHGWEVRGARGKRKVMTLRRVRLQLDAEQNVVPVEIETPN